MRSFYRKQINIFLCYICSAIRQNIIQKEMSEELQKIIMMKVKKIKCQQPECRSNNQQTLEVAVVGDQKLKRKGIMCTSCFIDQELFLNIGNVQQNALSIQKFLKVLTQKYLAYREEKSSPNWPPTEVEHQRQQIRSKIKQLQTNIKKAIFEIMKYIEDAMKEANQKVKKTNYQRNLEKIVQLLKQENQSEIERIKLTNELKQLSSKIVKDHGEYSLSTVQSLKKQNQVIMVEYKKKVARAKDTINRLIEIHKKCLKHLID